MMTMMKQFQGARSSQSPHWPTLYADVLSQNVVAFQFQAHGVEVVQLLRDGDALDPLRLPPLKLPKAGMKLGPTLLRSR